jgi:hypothetical protein
MKKLFFIAAVIVAATSCKKSSPVTEGCAVNADNIAGKYTVTAIAYRSSSTDAPTDIFSTMIDCEKDDSYELKTDGSVVISKEALDCGTPPPPGTPTTWALDKNNTVLIMGADLTIQSFDCKQLVVVEKNIMADGDQKTTTYKKQ